LPYGRKFRGAAGH